MKRETVVLFWILLLTSGMIVSSKTTVLKTEDLDTLTNISSFVLNEKGEAFLFSPKLGRIFKFGPDGEFEKHFCQHGQGPGEINRVFFMFHNPANDQLYLPEYYSMAKGKITIYDSQGNYMGLLKPEISRTHLDRVTKIIFLKDNFYIIVTKDRVGWKPVGKFFFTQDEVLVRCFNPEDKPVSVIFKANLNGEFSNAVRYGGPRILFAPSLLVNLTPAGQIAVGKTDENFISIYNTDGNFVKRITLDVPREKLTDTLFNKEKELLVERMLRSSDARMLNLARSMIKLEYKPICRGYFFSESHIILSRITEEDESGYPKKNQLIFFDWIGKKRGEKTINGVVVGRKDNKNLIIAYDDEGDETYRIEDCGS